jgi:hypothetical protein
MAALLNDSPDFYTLPKDGSLGWDRPRCWLWKASLDNSDVPGGYRHRKPTFQPGLFKLDLHQSAAVRSRRWLETVWMRMVVKTTAARMAKGRDPQWVPTQSRYNDERFRIGGTCNPTAHLVD